MEEDITCLIFPITIKKKNAISLLFPDARRGDRGSSSVYKSYDTSHRKSSVLLGVESGIHKHQVNGLYQEVFYLHLSHTGENMGFKRSVYLLLFGLDWLVFCRHADIRRIKMVCVFRGEWSGVGGGAAGA